MPEGNRDQFIFQKRIGYSPHAHVTQSSRAASFAHPIPSADDEDSFIAAVAAAVRARNYDVVFPVDDGQLTNALALQTA